LLRIDNHAHGNIERHAQLRTVFNAGEYLEYIDVFFPKINNFRRSPGPYIIYAISKGTPPSGTSSKFAAVIMSRLQVNTITAARPPITL
jgi:hypothetical protein